MESGLKLHIFFSKAEGKIFKFQAVDPKTIHTNLTAHDERSIVIM